MADDKRSPYVGPEPFRRQDKGLFFGRDQESRELLSLVVAHQAVLLYAQSGSGKTSLLNAGLVPLLEGRSAQVFAGVRVGGALPQGIELTTVRNIFTFNALLTMETASPTRLLDLTLAEYLLGIPYTQPADGSSGLRVVILDQLEEVFVSYPERWRDRATFFDEVGDALEGDTRLRVVLAMREEHIASMDPFAEVLPDHLRSRFRLERLREEAALQAVTMPLQGTGRSFAPGAAEKLVATLLQVPARSVTGMRDMSGEFVEPVQLQVVCQDLWGQLPPDVAVIDEVYVRDFGDVDKALSRYYEECIKQIVETLGIKEGVLRRWFEQYLITVDHTRGTVFKDVLKSGGMPNEVVEHLENLHLVRVEMRGGAPWYELTHDRFIYPILQSNAEWRAGIADRRHEAQNLEARAKGWGTDGQPERKLLSGDELELAQRWLASPDSDDLGVSDELRRLVAASETHHAQKVRTRRLRFQQIVAGTLLALLGAITTSIYVAKVHLEDNSFRERGQIARRLAAMHGREFDAVSLGVSAVARRVKSGAAPPAEATAGLRAAVAAVGHGRQLRSGNEKTIDIAATGKSMRMVALTATALRVWDLKRVSISQLLALPPEYGAISVDFSPQEDKLLVLRRVEKKNQAQSLEAWLPLWSDTWDLKKGRPSTSRHIETFDAFDFSRLHLLALRQGDKLRIENLVDGSEIDKMIKGAKGFGFTSSGKLLLVYFPGRMLIIDQEGGERWLNVALPTIPLEGDVSVDGQSLCLAGVEKNRGWVEIMTLRSSTEPVRFYFAEPATVEPLSALRFSSDSHHVIAMANYAKDLSRVLIFDAHTGHLERQYEFGRGFRGAGDSEIEVSASGESDRIRVLDLVTNKTLSGPLVVGYRVKQAFLAGEMSQLVTLDSEGVVRLTDLAASRIDFARLSPAELLAMGCWQLSFAPEDVVAGEPCTGVARPGFVQPIPTAPAGPRTAPGLR